MAAGTDSTTTSAAGAVRRLRVRHTWALAAVSSSMPIRAISGRICALQQLSPRWADVDAVVAHVDPVERRRVHPVRAEHPVEVDHADLARIGARQLAHERVVGLDARSAVFSDHGRPSGWRSVGST